MTVPRADLRRLPQAVEVAQGTDDLARYFRDIHADALTSPIARALAEFHSPLWKDVRELRRAVRLDAIRRSVKAIGAPQPDAQEATAMLRVLADAEICWPMHEKYGLAIDRIPDTTAGSVQLIVDQLKAKARETAETDHAAHRGANHLPAPAMRDVIERRPDRDAVA